MSMKSKSKAALVGLFVFGSITLCVLMLLLFSDGTPFSTNVNYFLYFDKSVKGLNVGAPVMFRGVRIGKVVDISLTTTDFGENKKRINNMSWPIRVTLEIVPEALEPRMASENLLDAIVDKIYAAEREVKIHEIITNLVMKEGMRARLESSSLLTGQLYIELNLFPSLEADRRLEEDLSYHVLPTSQSVLERLWNMGESQNFSTQIESLMLMLKDVQQYVESGKFRQLLNDCSSVVANTKEITKSFAPTAVALGGQLPSLFQHLEETVQNMDKKVSETLSVVNSKLDNFSQAADSAKTLADNLNQTVVDNQGDIREIVSRISTRTQELGGVLDEAKKTLASIQALTEENSPLQESITNTLQEIDKTAASVKILTDFLRHHPEALLRGDQ